MVVSNSTTTIARQTWIVAHSIVVDRCSGHLHHHRTPAHLVWAIDEDAYDYACLVRLVALVNDLAGDEVMVEP